MKGPSRFLKVCLIALVCILLVPLDSSQQVLGQDGDGTTAPPCPCPCPLTVIAGPIARAVMESFISGSVPDGLPTTGTDAILDDFASQVANLICMCPCRINALSLDLSGSTKALGAIRSARDSLSGSVLGQSLSKLYYGAGAS